HVALAQQEEVPVARVAQVEPLGLDIGRGFREERVRRLTGAAGTRRGHLDPATPFARAPGMLHPDRDRAARAGLEAEAASVEVEHRLAGEHVERGLERVYVRVDV